jgi:hypothetical protein
MKSAARAVLLAAIAVSPAQARIVFSGYAETALNLRSATGLSGPSAAQSVFKAATGRDRDQHSVSFPSAGIFADTRVSEQTSFALDVTFRNFGTVTAQTFLQYAYLQYTTLEEEWVFRAGKITVPFGLYNGRRFYPHTRPEVFAPLTQSFVLGLPIADLGASASRSLDLSRIRLELTAYIVNGYGPSPLSSATFRSPIAGGLSLAPNLRSTDNNDSPAFGGRLRVYEPAGHPVEFGGSFYRGDWDADGRHAFEMRNLFLTAKAGGAQLWLEAQDLRADGDPGMAAAVGSTDWVTRAFFAIVSYEGAASVSEVPLTPYLQYEKGLSEAQENPAARETLETIGAGVSGRVAENLLLKFGARQARYKLPTPAGSLRVVLEDVRLSACFTF